MSVRNSIYLKLLVALLLLFLKISDSFGYAYSINDYGFIPSSGTWGTTAANWKQWDGSGWNTIPPGPPTKNDNVFILSGKTCYVEASSKNCRNLTVESGLTRLLTNLNVPQSNRYIAVYGNIICDGSIGNGSVFDNICFNIEGVNDTIYSSTGTGAFDCSRMRKNTNDNAVTNLVISMNVTLRFDASSATQIYNNYSGSSTFNVTVSLGSTLNLTGFGNASTDGIDGAGSNERGGFYTINGTMNVPGTFFMSTDNLLLAYACGINISSTGILKVANPRPIGSSSGTYTLNMASGSLFQITGTPFTNSFSTVNNTYNLNPGSTIEYSGNGPQNIETNLNYANLKISGPVNNTPTISAGATTNVSAAISGLNNDNNISVSSITGITVGMLVSGTGISANAIITAISGSGPYNITLSVTNYATPSGMASFSGYTLTASPIGTITAGMSASGTGIAIGAAVTAVIGSTVYLSLPNTGAVMGSGNFSSDKKGSSGATVILGDLTMTGSVFYANSTTPFIYLGGNWTSTSKNNFFETGSIVVLNGSGSQTIKVTAGSEDFYNLKINKPSNKVYLSSSPTTFISVLNNLDLTSGNIVSSAITSSNYYVYIGAAATISNVSDNSFIEGNCGRAISTGPVNFTFPVGKLAQYRPISISDTATMSCSIFAEYYNSDPALIPTDVNNKAGTLNHISHCEYFKLRQVGTTTVQNFYVTLSWNSYSACPVGVTNLGTLRVTNCTTLFLSFTAGSNGGFTATVSSAAGLSVGMTVIGSGIGAGAKITNIAGNILTLSASNTSALIGTSAAAFGTWNDQGFYNTSGSFSSGNITTAGKIPFPQISALAAMPFTLASSDNNNPLPVELISFTAKADLENVTLNWITASEFNSDYFEIEKSADGINFENVVKKKSAGTTSETHTYNATDLFPFKGLSYYRLKQVDFDGTVSYSKIVAVNFTKSFGYIRIFPNPSEDNIQIAYPSESANEKLVIRIYNSIGQVVINQEFPGLENNIYMIPVNSLPAGVYNAIIENSKAEFYSATFAKRNP